MKKIELLSPAGNMECLLQAIHNGADAVYLGLKSFGARSFAKNFDEDEIIKAIKICHLYDVKIYVTMNTLVKENEVDDFISQVDFLHKRGVDAIIMQDFGMICLCREMFPNLELHASTQVNNTSIETIKFFHNLGVKRVVLSRELSLSEIKKIDVPIELEVFIHGALCISYSGNCLMSSMMGNRSGNRGECTGCCRLPYSLYKSDELISSNKYLLSTKEFNTSNHIGELLNSNITSFKIEGRMKSPEYVGFVTRMYRNLIDKKEINLTLETEKLKTLYNRKFTDGNLFESTSIMNIDTPNHIGLKIGKVVDISKGKIKIKLDKELNQEDGIRFLESGKGLICNYLYDDKNKLINNGNNYVYIDNKIDLKTFDTVYKTLDKKLNDSINDYVEKKIPINMKLIGKVNKRLKLIVTYNNITIEDESNVVEEAITSAISDEKIKVQLNKLGATPFILNNLELDVDSNIFISIKELNELRRSVVTKLQEKLENRTNNYLRKEVEFASINIKNDNNNLYSASVANEEQLKTCLKLDFSRIYVANIDVYKKYVDNEKVYYKERRNLFESNNYCFRKLVSEYREFNTNYIGNYFLNVFNSYSVYYLLKNGLTNFTLSVELSANEINQLMDNLKRKFNLSFIPEILVYGKCENMYIKGNILNISNDLYTYKLVDAKKREFDCYLDGGNTVILNYENRDLNISFDFKHYKRFDFYDESSNDIIKIVNKYQ